MKMSQVEFVKKRLEANGKVSRNECLRNYISRLGAIIYTLRREGYELEGKYVNTQNGRDYVYYVKKEV